jgi:hypothetical protein
VCREIEIIVAPDGRTTVFPDECDAGTHCRSLSAPYVTALGSVLRDDDALGGLSHVATCDLVVKDLDALERAAESLGLQLVRGQKTYRWVEKWYDDYHAQNAAYRHGIRPEDYGKNAEHAIVVPGVKTHEIGVVRRPDGKGFMLIWDFAGGYELCKRIARGADLADADRLRQAYAVEVARGTAIKQRQQVISTQTLVDGRVKIRIRV